MSYLRDIVLSSSSESDDDLDEDEYIVEKILDFKEERDKKGRLITIKYLVKWKDYDDPNDNTWEPEENMNASALLEEFWSQQGVKPNDRKLQALGRGRPKKSKPADKSFANSNIFSVETDSDVENESSSRPSCSSAKKSKIPRNVTPTNRGLKINDASMKRNSKFHEKNQRKIEKPVKSSQQTEKKNLEKSHKRANSSASKSGEPKKKTLKKSSSNSSGNATDTFVKEMFPRVDALRLSEADTRIMNSVVTCDVADTSANNTHLPNEIRKTQQPLFPDEFQDAGSCLYSNSFGRPSSSPSERLDSVDSPLHLNLDLSESPRVELPGLTPGISEEIQANFNYDHPVLKNPENLAQLVEAIKGIVNLSQRVQEAKNECLALKMPRTKVLPIPVEDLSFENMSHMDDDSPMRLLSAQRVNIENEVIIKSPNATVNEKFAAAVKLGLLSTVENMLNNQSFESKIDVEQIDENNCSLLMLLSLKKCGDDVRHQYCSIAEILIKHGANPDRATAMWSYTPLMAAVYMNHECCVGTLLKMGANPNCVNRKGESALTGACREGYLNCVELLMLSGADLDFKNSEGNTALQIATLRGEEDICASITSLKKKLRKALSSAINAANNGQQLNLRDPLAAFRMVMVDCQSSRVKIVFTNNREAIRSESGLMIVWFIATVRREFPADNDEFENVKINCDLFELDCVSDLTLNGESLEPLGITEDNSSSLAISHGGTWANGQNSLLLEIKPDRPKSFHRILLIQPWLARMGTNPQVKAAYEMEKESLRKQKIESHKA